MLVYGPECGGLLLRFPFDHFKMINLLWTQLEGQMPAEKKTYRIASLPCALLNVRSMMANHDMQSWTADSWQSYRNLFPVFILQRIFLALWKDITVVPKWTLEWNGGHESIYYFSLLCSYTTDNTVLLVRWTDSVVNCSEAVIENSISQMKCNHIACRKVRMRWDLSRMRSKHRVKLFKVRGSFQC